MSVHRCNPAAGPLDCAVSLPGSKSITNRALVLAALADGKSRLGNLLLAEDTRIMLAALRALGVSITVDEPGRVAEVTGCGGRLPASRAVIHCGNSGTTMRFCTAVVALGNGRFDLDGVERMRERPIGGLVEPLESLGSAIRYVGRPGYPPLEVSAHGLRGGTISVHSPESSQPISALLMVAPAAERDLVIETRGEVPSRPYIAMTAKLMRRFGVAVSEEYGATGARLSVSAPRSYPGTDLTIEPDASNASYFLAAPAVAGGRVTVRGLGTDSIQGDAGFVDVLERIGCRIERRPTRLTVEGPLGGRSVRGIDIDLNDMPDMVQTLAVLALFAEGRTVIRNVETLRVKETDRLKALARELTRLGATVEEERTGLVIDPPSRIRPATIDTYGDHRMAMAFSLAGLRVPGLKINDPECCAKTFPGFFGQFGQMTRA